MNLHTPYHLGNNQFLSDFYTAAGSFGVHIGDATRTEVGAEGFTSRQDAYTVTARICEEDGILLREDTLKNTGDAPLTLTAYAARFCLPGDGYDVYTQASFWQNESRGGWQPLVTEVSASASGMYSANPAAPMLALYHRQSGRGVVFHILPRHAWRIRASLRAQSNTTYTIVEVEVNDPALAIPLSAGEEVSFSPILYYEFRDRLSLDSHLLHAYLHRHYPRRPLPVLYNTWLAHFDNVDFDRVAAEVPAAAALGCECFTLDAGWFGEEGRGWWSSVGDWRENTASAYAGRMGELADLIRAHGMKFGLWLEPERANAKSRSYLEHPEYFIPGVAGASQFLDFANPRAVAYITDLTSTLIERYGIALVKLDFNDTLAYDPTHRAFLDYHRGQKAYLRALRERYPDLYIECCAGGGARMDIEALAYYDGVWYTDNQSVYHSTDILRGTLLRLPPAFLERWVTLCERDGFRAISGSAPTRRLFSTSDAKWEGAVSTTTEYVGAFFAGGAPAVSCHLSDLTKETLAALAERIATLKADRAFYTGATCRIIAEGEGLLCLQYENGDEARLVLYGRGLKNPAVTVYPTLPYADYLVDGVRVDAAALARDGVAVALTGDPAACTVTLERIK